MHVATIQFHFILERFPCASPSQLSDPADKANHTDSQKKGAFQVSVLVMALKWNGRLPYLSGNPMQCRCSRSESSTMQVGGFRVCRTFLCSFLFHFEPPGRMSWTCDLLAGKTTKLSLSQSLRGLRTEVWAF